ASSDQLTANRQMSKRLRDPHFILTAMPAQSNENGIKLVAGKFRQDAPPRLGKGKKIRSEALQESQVLRKAMRKREAAGKAHAEYARRLVERNSVCKREEQAFEMRI